MDLYPVLKVVHVLAATVWVGGGISLLLMTLTAPRTPDRLFASMEQMGRLGPLLFMPASILTVLSGGTLVLTGAWGAQPWIVAALSLVAVTFAVGALVIGPTGGKIAARLVEGDRDGAYALGLRVLRIARIDQAAQILVVVLMVAKPATWLGVAEIAVVVAALATAVLLAETRSVRPAAA